jgi:hypothetical protein
MRRLALAFAVGICVIATRVTLYLDSDRPIAAPRYDVDTARF